MKTSYNWTEKKEVSCQDIKVLNKLSCQFEHLETSVNTPGLGGTPI